MPGKQNTYTLGEFGVNRVKSPVHLIDGELLTAQNAAVSFEQGNRGLRKRSGMAKLNTEAAAGPILSMHWIPLPDPNEDILSGPGDADGFEVFVDGGGGSTTTMRTTNGTTFVATSLAGKASALNVGQPPKSYYFDGRVYYAGATLGQILFYDGSGSGLEATLPATHPTNGSPLTAVVGLCGIGNTLYILATYDSPYSQVLKHVVGTSVVTAFCEGFKNTVGAESGFLLRSLVKGPVPFAGEIWIACANQAGTDGSYLRAAGSATIWTEDRTTSGRYPSVIGSVGTSLWFTTFTGATNYQLERRDAGGSYTVVRGPQAAAVLAAGAVGDRVYVVQSSNLERSTNNGGSFTTLATGTISSSSGAPGKLTLFNGLYHLCLSSEVLRDNGGTVTELAVGGLPFLSGFVSI